MTDIAADSMDGLQVAAACTGATVHDLRAANPRAILQHGAVHWCRVTRQEPRGGAGWGRIDDQVVRLDLAGGPTPGSLSDRPVLVQVTVPARSGRAAEAATDVALPGRFLVHRPFGSRIQAARRLSDFDASAWADRLPRTGGWLVRTRAAEAAPIVLMAEAQSLAELGAALRAAGPRSDDQAVAVLPGPTPVHRLIFDLIDPQQLAVGTADAARALTAWCTRRAPDLAAKVVVRPVDLSETVAAALDPIVTLQGGGRLTIEPTTALVAVDVDLGSADHAQAANLQACHALAPEIRRRNLSGAIVMDLIGTPRRPADQQRLVDALMSGFRGDVAIVHPAGINALGLLSFSRQRRGPSLAEVAASLRTRG